MKPKNEMQVALKAMRKKRRDEEIALFGHPINYRKVFKNKKKYDRKRDKANQGSSPYLFFSKAISN
ncbi:MAG TPA: hypothetical protein P5564_01075 [Paludibacteraceae bacterium]|jgi:hypothetical protein|nr:hypothetical protein [Paludibacteraceae bacterium]